ncbi:hypothetical protein QFC22_003634 [Naganishia vaughanmartiniae]|uniref:Uncharacterized protein n=1 Tax=Naganishia vaughanmartiniae TaxID=1424756 RepID=A0ACC2X5V6_9TREE|nr:hypothetical protein QFC22_003634 [Naganishia vaughanmartiniae]
MATAQLAIPPPIFSPFLDDQCGKINAKGVSWEGYQRAKLVSAEEVDLLKTLERQGKSQRAATFATQGSTYAKLYIDLLRKLQKVDTVQAVLVGISNMLSDQTTLPLFHNLSQQSDSKSDDPYGPLIKCLSLQDEFVLLEALRIMAILVSTDPKPIPEACIPPMLDALAKLTNANPSPARDLAIQVLGAILGSRQIRKAAWDQESLLSGLIKALKANPSPQLQYWIIICFWQLSFEIYAAEELDKRFDLVALFAEVARTAAKEKVTRVVMATLRNLMALAPSANINSMVVQKVLPLVKSFSQRKWSDDEVIDDIKYLRDELDARLSNLSTFDEYASEVESGHLSWSPTHESEDFWKENVEKIRFEKNGQVVKQLVALLSSSRDPVVLAVAVHDIGQFIKFGDDGARKMINDLDGKLKVMELLSHESGDVKYQALLTVQRIMSHSWTS